MCSPSSSTWATYCEIHWRSSRWYSVLVISMRVAKEGSCKPIHVSSSLAQSRRRARSNLRTAILVKTSCECLLGIEKGGVARRLVVFERRTAGGEGLFYKLFTRLLGAEVGAVSTERLVIAGDKADTARHNAIVVPPLGHVAVVALRSPGLFDIIVHLVPQDVRVDDELALVDETREERDHVRLALAACLPPAISGEGRKGALPVPPYVEIRVAEALELSVGSEAGVSHL